MQCTLSRNFFYYVAASICFMGLSLSPFSLAPGGLALDPLRF